jgi:flagellar FliJ protein
MENILSIKHKVEDQAKTAYGNARMKLTEEEEKLAELKHKLSLYMERIRKIMQSKLNLVEIRRCEEAVNIIKHHIKQQELIVKKAEHNLELTRTRLNAAMLERKTHENLKDKALANFLIEYESEQRKEIDELVSFKYNNPTDY